MDEEKEQPKVSIIDYGITDSSTVVVAPFWYEEVAG